MMRAISYMSSTGRASGSTSTCSTSSRDVTWQAAAAAHILEARKRQGRVGGKKSRAGCLTCKTRRIKCDEQHPQCGRCRSSGRRCDGYGHLQLSVPGRSSNNSNNNSNCLIGRQLSLALGLADNDSRRAFDYYLSWTAPRLAGVLDKDFWCGHVLQLAQHEPLILDSLLALSTLYEHPQYRNTFLPSPHHHHPRYSPRASHVHAAVHPAIQRPSGGSSIDEHDAAALRYYNRAIRRFDQKMADGTASPQLALLSCALFICIEIIRDHVLGAVSLVVTGCALTRHFSTCPEGMNPALYDAIIQMFARISVLASSFGHPAEHDLVEWSSHSPPESAAFSTLSDARAMLFRLLGETHATLRLTSDRRKGAVAEGNSNVMPACANDSLTEQDLANVPPPLPRPHEPSGGGGHATHMGKRSQDLLESEPERIASNEQHEDLYDSAWRHGDISAEHRMIMQLGDRKLFSDPVNMQKRQARLQRRWMRWYDSFRHMCPHGPEENEAAATMLMFYHLAVIMMHAMDTHTQMIFDECTPHFEEIIRLSEIYVHNRIGEHSIFTFEVGTIPPLYWAATKCRIPSLRRRALELLLKAPAKECLWGARSCAEVVARLIAIEEEGLGHPVPSLVQIGLGGGVSAIDDSILPPEHQRVHHLGILVNEPANRFDIRVTRYIFNAETGLREKVYSDYPI